MRFFNLGNHNKVWVAFRVGIFGGIIGVLVDIDHVISYWLTGEATRAAHIYLMYISIAVICGTMSYIGGFYLERFLARRKK